ncbi:Wzz/FepE/Etk N-terminal domain-containing protein, partial [Poseidonibacter sp.]|uniref:Wzz/FepE/Etk N-terminal domain-containing protein n=1 Tax=Poseidonibacter sp. TaxID=2321188 RepID=UPI003C73BD24
MSEINNIEKVQKNDRFIEEDEIDLKELFNTIFRYKYKIAFFSFLVCCASLAYVLSIPNSYKSQIILAPQGESGGSALGGLSSLASLAGVSGGGSGSKDPVVMMETVLKDYEFNKQVIEKYNLVEKLQKQENLVFAMGIDYFAPSKDENQDKISEEEKVFMTINSLKTILSISSDKKTNLITLSAERQD